MKPSFALLFVLGTFAYADVPNTTPPPPARPEETAKPPEAARPVMQQESRTVIVHEKDVIQVKAQLRVTTLIVLPQREKVMTVYCGDKDNWVIDGMENFVTIKPSKQGAHTDVHILTDHANAYTLSLTEVSQTGAMSDVKIFLQPGEDSGNVRLQGNRVFVNAQVAERYKEEAAAANARAEAIEQEAQKNAAAEAEKFRASYPAKLHFDYTIERGRAPFNVSAIYRDDKFTYIRANPQEVPALYEVKDGKPSLINYDFANGLYTIPKIIDAGYLAIGKQKLNFFRAQN